MPLSLLNHSALALFAQRTRIPTSARSIGFCAIWVCISSSSSLHLPMNSTPLCIHWNDGLDSFAALHAIYRRFGTIATLL